VRLPLLPTTLVGSYSQPDGRIDRAGIDVLHGAQGTTALHVCFGYGRHVSDKPPGYSFLEELDSGAVDQVSLECAQSNVNPKLLTTLPSKTILLDVRLQLN
jgi:hypothetical protein